MGFGHVQGAIGSSSGSVFGQNVVLGAAPTTGNIVCVAVLCDSASAVTSMTVKDSNNNSYTESPHSPALRNSGNARIFLFYLVNAPSNASATITASFTPDDDVDVYADEFSVTGGTAAFDKDSAGSNTFAGTTVNLPAIVPTGSNELLYSAALPSNEITNPAAGVTQGVWVGATGGPNSSNTGGGAEYCLSATGSTAPNYTDAGTGDIVAVISMAFSFTSSGGSPAFEDDSYKQLQPLPIEPIVSVW